MALGIGWFMNDLQIFRRTRWRLAYWYSGVMGVILGVCSIGVYEAIDHAHRIAADRELQAVAGQIHDILEPTLTTPNISPSSLNLLPDSCIISQCEQTGDSIHAPGTMLQGNYYIRLVSPTGNLVALAGLKPQGISPTAPGQTWQTLRDGNQNRYRQITLALQNPEAPLWGYLQVGSSLETSDNYLAVVRWAFGIGFPLSLLWVGGASWWLSGRAMAPIYRSYQQMRQFTADAAHELRTPIAAAQATVESVLGSPEDVTNETFQVLDRQHHRLSVLVQDLLLLTRLDQENRDFTRCCLQDIVSDVSEEVAALALKHQLQFKTKIEIESSLWVYGNEEQLFRLVFNLVINAFQYTPSQGTVILRLGMKDEKAMIQVSDTGIGIDAEYQTMIFERFTRVESNRSRQSGGAGLGLAIAQAIAKSHQGKITLQSTLGQGSTFSVLLPIKTT